MDNGIRPTAPKIKDGWYLHCNTCHWRAPDNAGTFSTCPDCKTRLNVHSYFPPVCCPYPMTEDNQRQPILLTATHPDCGGEYFKDASPAPGWTCRKCGLCIVDPQQEKK